MGERNKSIRLGMVGGGQGAFIGEVHRIAARLDGRYHLVAGALSSDRERAMASGRDLGLADDRIYTDFNVMAQVEATRADGIQAVAIVTPNHVHFAPAKAFLNAGIHVICDKPITATVKEAQALAAITPKNNAQFLLTHNYVGYPMVRLAREMVSSGKIGKIRIVQVDYLQDWLASDISSKQASWRTDPKRAGIGGAIGDIGTHAYNLMRFVTQLSPRHLSANLTSFVPHRKLDDDAHIQFRFDNCARGQIWASQVACGHENDLSIRVIGETGSLKWAQTDCDTLWYSNLGNPTQKLRRGGPLPDFQAGKNPRVPAGHPEGYLEAFATLYSDFADVLHGAGQNARLPSLADGLEGVHFIATSVESSQASGAWLEF